jgi:hypothetical protein
MNHPDFYSMVAALLAFILLLDISVLWLTGRQVPELLSQLIFGVFGFYFGRAPGLERPARQAPDVPRNGRYGADGRAERLRSRDGGQADPS